MTGRRWAYCGALLGGAVSIAANVAHSYVPPPDAAAGWQPHAGAVLGAVFWPVALFVAIEILARVAWPAGARWLIVRYLGLLPVAVVAAVVSYRHLSGLLAFYQEDPLTFRIGPLAVDGLMVMATGALIATGARTFGAAARIVSETAAAPTADLPEPAPAGMTADMPPEQTPTRTRRTPAVRTTAATVRPDSAAAKVARMRAKRPDATQAEVAKRAGLSIRTVARHWQGAAPDNGPDTAPVDGAAVPALAEAVAT